MLNISKKLRKKSIRRGRRCRANLTGDDSSWETRWPEDILPENRHFRPLNIEGWKMKFPKLGMAYFEGRTVPKNRALILLVINDICVYVCVCIANLHPQMYIVTSPKTNLTMEEKPFGNERYIL